MFDFLDLIYVEIHIHQFLEPHKGASILPKVLYSIQFYFSVISVPRNTRQHVLADAFATDYNTFFVFYPRAPPHPSTTLGPGTSTFSIQLFTKKCLLSANIRLVLYYDESVQWIKRIEFLDHVLSMKSKFSLPRTILLN